MSYENIDTVDKLVAEKTEEITDFLYNLSRNRENIYLHEELYENCIDIIEQSIRFSTRATFEKYPFWDTLNPQLQNKIVKSVLKN